MPRVSPLFRLPNTRKKRNNRPYRRKVMTHCAKIRGSRPFTDKHGKFFNATRGNKIQVWNNTAHHICTETGRTSKLERRDFMLNKWGRIVSKKRHAAGKKSFALMDPDLKTMWKANYGRGFEKDASPVRKTRHPPKLIRKSSRNQTPVGRARRNTARVDYTGMMGR